MTVAFRCDGDERVGAGHVARCIQIAVALRAGGTATVFAGTYTGVAAELLAAAGLDTEPPGGGPLGAPARADAVIVDSYEIEAAAIGRAATQRPVVAIADEGPPPPATAVLCYHLDAAERVGAGVASLGLLGAAYAPVAPALVAARRPRGFRRALVTMGGGATGAEAAERAARELLALDESLEITVAATGPDRIGDDRVAWSVVRGGLGSVIASSDVAVSAAGSTPYDLAAAGVPAVLRAIAPNQQPVRAAFLAAGLALDRAEALACEDERIRCAAAGAARIDGYGAFRVRDGVAAVLAGRSLPRVLAYRPATPADAGLLLTWRNEPAVREMSRSSRPIGLAEHRAWLTGVLADPARTLLVAELEGRPVGTLRFDREGGRAEISVALDPQERGGGLGTQAIRETTELQLAADSTLREVVAEVQSRNLRSLRAFERAGYRMAAEAGDGEGSAVLVRAASPP